MSGDAPVGKYVFRKDKEMTRQHKCIMWGELYIYRDNAQ